MYTLLKFYYTIYLFVGCPQEARWEKLRIDSGFRKKGSKNFHEIWYAGEFWR